MFHKWMLAIFLCFAAACGSSSDDEKVMKPGELDPTFGAPDGYVLNGGWNKDSYVGLALQEDGKLVVSTGQPDGDESNVIVLRYGADGNPDGSFGNGGQVTYNGGNGKDCGRSALIDADEKIVLTGYVHNGTDYDLLLMRLNTDGTLDDSFGSGGVVWYDHEGRNDYGRGIAIQTDGKIIVTARSTGDDVSKALMLRWNVNGTADAEFGVDGCVVYESGGGNDGFRDVALQTNGKIVVTGYTRTDAGFEILTARFLTDGTRDTSFGTDGVVRYDGGHGNAGARGVGLLPDGRIAVSGSNDNGGDLDVVVLMYDADGIPDTGFGLNGVVIYDGGKGNDNGRRMAVQGSDWIVVAGNTYNGNDYDTLVLRYAFDGTPDPVFGDGGIAIIHLSDANQWGEAVTVSPDEKIVVAGGMDGETDDVLTMRLIGSSLLF